MAALASLLVAAVSSAGAGLPTRRAAKDPWPTAASSAEAVRQLHELLPHDAEVSEEEMAGSFQRFLDARGGRFEPIWANHSHAERTANLRQHRAKRQSERRRAQSLFGSDLFADTSEEARASGLVAVLDAPSSTCDDPLASNTGQPQPCAYDCADLQREYFPEPQSQTTRCFLFASATNTWPEAGGQGA